MARECRECGGEIVINGIGCTDGVVVECLSCGEVYEVEPDGLGECGDEWIEAKIIEASTKGVKE
jgi:hypothetical protein